VVAGGVAAAGVVSARVGVVFAFLRFESLLLGVVLSCATVPTDAGVVRALLVAAGVDLELPPPPQPARIRLAASTVGKARLISWAPGLARRCSGARVQAAAARSAASGRIHAAMPRLRRVRGRGRPIGL